MGFSFFYWKEHRRKKRENGSNPMKEWLVLTHCRNSVGGEDCLLPVVPFRCGFRHLLGFLLHPAAALFELEDPYNSWSFRSHRLSPTHLCLPGVNPVRGNGEETRVLLQAMPGTQSSLKILQRGLMATVPWSRIRGRDETCGRGWHLWHWVCVTGLHSLGYQLNSSAFPRPSHWGWQLDVHGCENCAVVIHTYCMCYMQVENMKLGCFDLLNTSLLNLKQHSVILSKFFLPKCGNSASTGTLIWLDKHCLGSPRDGWWNQRLLQPVALSSTM